MTIADATDVVRIGVCGLGVMGSHHARVLTEIPGVRLVAVCDTDVARSEAAAGRYGATAYRDLRALLKGESLNAVSICVPTLGHAASVALALEHGIATLVEKPLANSVALGEELCRQAESLRVLLAVGHIERYNPAIGVLKKLLATGNLGRVLHYGAKRVGPSPQRRSDTGVILDLATHDIDVVRYLSDSEPSCVSSLTAPARADGLEELLIATLILPDGGLVTLEASRLTPEKRRELTVLAERGMLVANYLTQELVFYENDYAMDGWQQLAQLRGGAEGTVTRLRVPRAEPLRLELESFIDAVRGGPSPVVTSSDALRTLRVAEALSIAAGNRAVSRAHLD